MITIKDIAKLANVSDGTVDRVIHKRGGVSKKTESKILEILKTHNFEVNPIASALAKKNTYSIATLIPKYDDDNLFWKSPYLGVLKARQEVMNLGVRIDNYTFDQFEPQSYIEQFNKLLESNPTAVILVPVFIEETKKIVSQLEEKNIPYLFLNIDLGGFNNVSFLGQDSYLGGYIAGKLMHLSLKNETSLLVIQTRHNVSNYHHISKRIEGFQDYFIKNNLNVAVHTMEINDLENASNARKQINSFLGEHPTISGIFVPSSRVSLVVNSIEENLLNKVDLIGFDNTPQNIKCMEADKISFLISQKPFDQGYDSIKLMTDLLVKKKAPTPRIYSPIDILTKENVIYNDRTQLAFENEHEDLIK